MGSAQVTISGVLGDILKNSPVQTASSPFLFTVNVPNITRIQFDSLVSAVNAYLTANYANTSIKASFEYMEIQ